MAKIQELPHEKDKLMQEKEVLAPSYFLLQKQMSHVSVSSAP